MAELINLRKARKERGRREKEAAADAARAKHAQSKREKAARDAAAQKARRNLDGHKRTERLDISPSAGAPAAAAPNASPAQVHTIAKRKRSAPRDPSDANK